MDKESLFVHIVSTKIVFTIKGQKLWLSSNEANPIHPLKRNVNAMEGSGCRHRRAWAQRGTASGECHRPLAAGDSVYWPGAGDRGGAYSSILLKLPNYSIITLMSFHTYIHV